MIWFVSLGKCRHVASLRRVTAFVKGWSRVADRALIAGGQRSRMGVRRVEGRASGGRGFTWLKGAPWQIRIAGRGISIASR